MIIFKLVNIEHEATDFNLFMCSCKQTNYVTIRVLRELFITDPLKVIRQCY